MIEIYEDKKAGPVEFEDINGRTRSTKCHPRDIKLAAPANKKTAARLRFDICADIRRAQGFAEVGLMKGALV